MLNRIDIWYVQYSPVPDFPFLADPMYPRRHVIFCDFAAPVGVVASEGPHSSTRRFRQGDSWPPMVRLYQCS